LIILCLFCLVLLVLFVLFSLSNIGLLRKSIASMKLKLVELDRLIFPGEEIYLFRLVSDVDV
jgi:hypothetical protein